ncbi:glycosyltransferase family 28 protein [Teladorsagia circumcincta]|uniref:glucuronosyltransferase n=1 Tax=Teladorsagia circumcincta TaxID=45464 RepID=A0A2G9U7P7_TELCI|nr:glycosyltransferase family 28 protein [Teladorsagia circumcincta]
MATKYKGHVIIGVTKTVAVSAFGMTPYAYEIIGIRQNPSFVPETPRPTANIVRYIGGLAVHPPKPLGKSLDAVLDERSTNVLLSFGTISRAKDMPLWLKKDIVQAFSAFPNTTFIWKYEDENDSHLFKDHPNIHTMKWVPQSDLLGDKRLSAFITHAGMNSILEATFFGKPLVVVPLFGDQYLNAKNVERRGMAVMIGKNELNKDTLTAAIREVLSTNSHSDFEYRFANQEMSYAL